MMRLFSFIGFPSQVIAHTDGAIRQERGASGLAAVAHDERGNLRALWTKQVGRLTCNEAEYAAAILALERLLPYKPAEIVLLSDSQVMVHQMTGIATAQSPKLKQKQAALRGLVTQFEQVTFRHIPREQNRLADALANEAADGKEQSCGWK